MPASTGAHLTSSRVHRVFRSLRAKCANLATFSSPKAHSKLKTYSSSSRKTIFDHENPPLVVLQPPESLGARIHLDRASLDNLQISRKIYEVRDAFRNIVKMSLGGATGGWPSNLPRMTSLAAICATVVGTYIHHEMENFQDMEDSDDEVDENDAAEVFDELFESIPPHYRSYTVISHALSYVLETCPHYTTLLASLLDVCLSSGLLPESHTLLKHMFAIALRSTSPSATYPCPLTHPAHSNYLTALRATCCDRTSGSQEAGSFRLEDTVFTRLFVDVLTNIPSRQVDAWTSRAVARLARDLRSNDFGAFVHLCVGVAEGIADTEQVLAKRKAKRKGEDEYDDQLRHRLARWVKAMLDHLCAPSSGDGVTISNDDYDAIIDFLLHAGSLKLHVAVPSPPTSAGFALADAIICLATSCLASSLRPTLHPTDWERLHDTLRGTQPTPQTYNLLAAQMFALPPPQCPLFDAAGTEETPTPPPAESPNGGMVLLRELVRPLRRQRLYLLEASLCASALRHVEDMCSSTAHADADALRAELVARVERAEAHCFGEGRGGAGPSGGNGEWEWEEMVGAWVRKAESPCKPQAKKRKAEDAVLEQPKHTRALRARMAPGSSLNPAGRRSLPQLDARHHLPGQARGRISMGPERLHPRPSPNSVGPSSAEGRTETPRDRPKKARLWREGFATLVRDAQRNCIVLHPKEAAKRSEGEPLKPKALNMPQTPARRSHSRSLEQLDEDSPRQSGYCSANQLSSDDALNLFAYASSPVAPKLR